MSDRAPPGPVGGSAAGAGALPGQGNHLLNRRTRGAGGGPTLEEGEFDFQAGLARFDKEKVTRFPRGARVEDSRRRVTLYRVVDDGLREVVDTMVEFCRRIRVPGYPSHRFGAVSALFFLVGSLFSVLESLVGEIRSSCES